MKSFYCCLLLVLLCPAISVASSATDIPALPPGAQMDLYLLVGQSNMAGRGKVEAQDKVPNPQLWMLTKSSQWALAVDPMHFDKKIAGVGPGRTFGIAVAETNKKLWIGLVPCAVGGTSIDQWEKGQKLYNDAMERAKAASAHGKFKAILWHQGESDLTPTKREDYFTKLKKLITNFREDLKQPEIPFIVGQLGPFHQKAAAGTDTFNTQLTQFGEQEPYCACVSSEGLTDIGDNTHFDAASQRELGRRYAAAYLKLIDDSSSHKP